MFSAEKTQFLVPFDKPFNIARAATCPSKKSPSKAECKTLLSEQIEVLSELQKLLYAHNHHAVLLVFQAMDAAGKDGTIRAVMSGVNPAGCQVYSFKQPSANELDHDFLWRTSTCLPERGRIGIFNRSYYEETLVVRVHPEYVTNQRIVVPKNLDDLWESRFKSICDHEKHLAENGTLILKFWLNVSKDEQRQRFLSRLDEPAKNWKFSESDIAERAYWDKYMHAYKQTLQATSKPWAPWYAIPADSKPYMRLHVAKTIVKNMKKLKMHYPKVTAADKKRFAGYRQELLFEE